MKLKGNTDDQERIDKLGGNWSKKYHVVDKFANGDTNGFLDTAAGITLADKVMVVIFPDLSHVNERIGMYLCSASMRARRGQVRVG